MKEDIEEDLEKILNETDTFFELPKQEKKNVDPNKILIGADHFFFKSQTHQTRETLVSLAQFKNAIIKNDTESCYHLIKDKLVNLFDIDSNGFTPLMTAITVERFDIADTLTEKKEEAKQQIKPVITRFMPGFIGNIPFLPLNPFHAKLKSNLTKKTTIETPFLLHLIEFGKEEACKYLLEKNLVDKNELSQDEKKFNALMFAIAEKQFFIADYLMAEGANTDYLKKWRYDEGDGPTSFLFYFIDLIGIRSNHKAIFYLIDQKLFDKDEKDTRGFSLLMAAIITRSFVVANGLIKRGMGSESIVFSKLLEKNNLEICKYVVENGLVDINEEHIRKAKKLKANTIVDYLATHLNNKREKKSAEIEGFFKDLLGETKKFPIIEVVPLPFNQRRVVLNDKYSGYSELTKNINKLSGKKSIELELGNRGPLKSFILSIDELKENDFTQLKQAFKIEKQIIQKQAFKSEQELESFIEPNAEKKASYIKPHKKTSPGNFSYRTKDEKKEKSPNLPKPKHNAPKNKKSNVVTKQSMQSSAFKTQLTEKKSNPSRNLPIAPGISFSELKTVNKYSETIEKISYLPFFSTPLNASKHKKLTFSYYHTDTDAISTIETFALPPEKGKHLLLLKQLHFRVKIQLDIDQDQACIHTQALIYDMFILLELIPKTLKLENQLNDLLPLRKIEELRQLMKRIIFNEHKQNLNLNNLIREAKKICNGLQSIFNALEQNSLIAINPLNISCEDLIISRNTIHSSFDLASFSNHDLLTSIEYFNIIPYVDGLLSYIAIIEDENETLETRRLALSAASCCVLGVDKKKKVFENYIGKSESLDHTFDKLHTARNQLAHTENNQKPGTVKDLDENKKIILDLKECMTQLQKRPDLIQQTPINTTIKI